MNGKFISLKTKLKVAIGLQFLLFMVIAMILESILLLQILFMNVRSSVSYEHGIAEKGVENVLSVYVNGATIVQNSTKVQELLSLPAGDQRSQLDVFRELEEEMDSVKYPLSLYRIALYCDGDYFFVENNPSYIAREELEQYPEYKEISTRKPIFWIGPEKISDGTVKGRTEVVSFLKAIGNNNSPVGYQKISIRKRELTEVLDFGDNYEAETCIYFPEQHKFLSNNDESQLYEKADTFIQETFIKEKAQGWQKCRIDGKQYYICCNSVYGSNWKLITAFPANEIVFAYARNILCISLIVICLIQFASWHMINHIMNRMLKKIYALGKIMNESQLNIIPEEPKRYWDEIDYLYREYNRMTERNKLMMIQQTQTEREKRKYELSAMQAQINPHFLYNTLDLLHWKAIEMDAPDAVNITEALASFYRLTLSNGREIVTLKDELRHIDSYVKIQNHRFDCVMDLQVEIPEYLLEIPIPKLTLQPLIENSIQHGFLPKANREGSLIEIYAWEEEEDTVVIQVGDNGLGMTEEQVREILISEVKNEEHGYGVKNINERLKLYYSGECGLSYESTPDLGTTVYIRIKKTL